jgi:hypothetical protein
MKPRLGALLSSDDFGVESRAGRWRSSVMAIREKWLVASRERLSGLVSLGARRRRRLRPEAVEVA